MKKRLITSALPYVNNIPHLGNIIQVLSADVFARFCRLRGYNTLYICGSDEYGTATETRAMEEGISPRELCDRNHPIHRSIYKWFNIDFDHYGRTSSEYQSKIVQDIFLQVSKAGYITQKTSDQFYSEKSKTFLADRYLKGECPHCHYSDARGDQCENCGKLLDPQQLIDPLSVIDNSKPQLKETSHYYINLPAILPKLQVWMKDASRIGRWSHNALNMTKAWIRDGLKERAITRDLKWGIPVPGSENKVFYVWFDAPIGYISITAEYFAMNKNPHAWKDWWQSPDEVELFQFIGKDNIPFHTVIFPSTLIASGENWTMLHHMSSTEYMNYEGGKFSKSKGVGVFGNEVQETGISADIWRFYLFYNRPETSDYNFQWKDFQEITNKQFIGSLANLVNRILRFQLRFFEDTVECPNLEQTRSREFWEQVQSKENNIGDLLEWAQIRDALRELIMLADFGNKVFQEAEPWKLRKSNPQEAKEVLSDLIFLIRDLAVLSSPFIPETAMKIAGFLSFEPKTWSELGHWDKAIQVKEPSILLKPLDDELIETLQVRFSGDPSAVASQERNTQVQKTTLTEQKQSSAQVTKPSTAEKIRIQDAGLSLAQRFLKRIELRVAKIIEIEEHPNANSLFIEKLDDGSGRERTIVSGLRKHYRAEELLNKNIIVVANLVPAKLRGVISQGMLLAAQEGNVVDVIFADWAEPGDMVEPENLTNLFEGQPKQGIEDIDIDTFLDIPLVVQDHILQVGGITLRVAGKQIASLHVAEGRVA